MAVVATSPTAKGGGEDTEHPLWTARAYYYLATWISKVVFDGGSHDDTEVSGLRESAVVQLEENTDSSDDVPFTTPANYIYDAGKIQVTGGKALLKPTVADEKNWSFTTPANYTYIPADVEVTGGVAKLVGVPEDPYLWYHLNEAAGANAADASSNGRDGTLQNMEDGDWIAGKLNNCLSFGGVNESVNAGDVADFDYDDAYSADFWMRTSSTAVVGLVTKVDPIGTQPGWGVFIVENRIRFIIKYDATYRLYVTGGTVVTDGAWHHVVVTYDSSGIAAGVTIYVDGSPETPTVGQDSLNSTSVSNGGPFSLASRSCADLYYTGDLDEVVVYGRELTSGEVTIRYNSGAGTELPFDFYPLTNPTIYPSSGWSFSAPLDTFTETATKPAGSALKYHVSSDDGVTWKYWNGAAWVTTDDSYAQANTAADVHANIATLTSSGTLRFRALLHSDAGDETPELDNIYVAEGTEYPTGNNEIEMDWDLDPAINLGWLLVTETVTKPANTDIKYQYSLDSGVSYNGSWLTSAEMQTALQAVGSPDKVRVKFQLSTTDNLVTPEISNLNITADSGYMTSGTYTSKIYDAGVYYGYSTNYDEFTFLVDEPGTSDVDMYVRASNDSTDLLSESWAGPKASGDDAGVEGRYLQWKAEMTGPGEATPHVAWVKAKYETPGYVEDRA